MTIANICKVKVKKGCIGLMFCLTFIMFIFSLSQGYFDIFYKNPSYEMVNGFASIKKEYGFMHTVYIVYICLMLVLIIGLFIYALKKRKTPSTLYTVLIFLAAFVNVFLWVIERFLPKSVEFLAGSYLVTEVILLVVYRYLEKMGAFDYCTTLREAVIPLSVTSIGNYAFDDSGVLALLIESSVKQSGWTAN